MFIPGQPLRSSRKTSFAVLASILPLTAICKPWPDNASNVQLSPLASMIGLAVDVVITVPFGLAAEVGEGDI